MTQIVNQLFVILLYGLLLILMRSLELPLIVFGLSPRPVHVLLGPPRGLLHACPLPAHLLRELACLPLQSLDLELIPLVPVFLLEDLSL